MLLRPCHPDATPGDHTMRAPVRYLLRPLGLVALAVACSDRVITSPAPQSYDLAARSIASMLVTPGPESRWVVQVTGAASATFAARLANGTGQAAVQRGNARGIQFHV